ncbi:hypothetical protein [Opitutus terrae]|nr:hypothetical protein [Opitutus terrae]
MVRSVLRRFLFLFVSLAAAGPFATAMSVRAPSFAALVAESSTIVRARVVSVDSRKVPTPAGDAIKTFVTLEVARPLKGAADRTVTLSFLGGQVGDERWEIPGMPQFTPGSEEYLFITTGSRICPLVGAAHGRYRILPAPATGQPYVARDNYAPLAQVADVSRPLDAAAPAPDPSHALSPARFEQLIAGELSRTTRPDPQR